MRILLAFVLLTISAQAFSKSEREYTEEFCPVGHVDVPVSKGSRVDCLAWGYAMEVDWSRELKPDEGIGQALRYWWETGKEPALTLLIENGKECAKAARALAIGLAIKPVIKVFVYGPAADQCGIEVIPKLR